MPPTDDRSPRWTSLASGRLAPVSEDPAPLFVYGSLLFPEVVEILLDHDRPRQDVIVPGWRVVALPNQVYPTLVRDDASTASGHLMLDLTPTDWRTLDAFENDAYDLARVHPAHVADHAYAFVSADPSHYGGGAWHVEHFVRDALKAYLVRCAAWRRRYDEVTTAG